VLKANSRLFQHLALVTDLVLIALCWIAAYVVRFNVFGRGDIPPFSDYTLQLVPILVVWFFAYKAFDLYRPTRLGSHLSEWLDIAKASTLGVLVLVAGMTFLFHGYEYSRLVILMFWVASIVTVSFSRAAFREVLRFARRRGYNQRYAVVVGGGEPAAEVVRVLHRRRDTGIQLLGVLSDKQQGEGGSARWLGGIEEIRTVLATRQVDIVIIALPHDEYPRLSAVLSEIGDEPVAIHFVPDLFSLASLRGGVEEFESIAFIHLRESPLYGWNQVLKRAFDLGVGAAAVLVTLPFMAAIAAAVAATSGRPIFFRQERMGLDGRRFQMLKFRTMRTDAEAQSGPQWAVPGDPRRTRLGAFLRGRSLDELPQIFNVLRGEMSLVGPRPERPSFVAEFRRRVPGYMLRHKMKAGITGWAQINGWRGNTSIEKRIEYDLEYIARWSLGFDLYIVLRTLWLVLHDRNAY
jgi:Undecaprenyl-phosphate glucose phosphotransferase